MRCAAFDLAYCTNVHPGEGLSALHGVLGTHVAAVKARVAPKGKFGTGLRLGSAAARALVADPGAARELAARLTADDLYVFTVNGFPHGDFAAPVVKETVYRPSWLDAERLRYTLDLARALAALPGPATRSLSTVGGCFRPDGDDAAAHARMAEHLRAAAVGLARIADDTGVSVRLCLEPEPGTTLERTADALDFFKQSLGLRDGRFAGAEAEAVGAHLGLCYDCCHQAVLFEDAVTSLDALLDAGLPIGKVQVSSALHLARPADAEARAALLAFGEPRYFHQTAADVGAAQPLFALDLGLVPQGDHPEAARWNAARAWRTHFHVPIWWPGSGHLGTTRADWVAVVQRLKSRMKSGLSSCSHLEIETYTWDVIPAADRAHLAEGDLHACVAAEFAALQAVIEAET